MCTFLVALVPLGHAQREAARAAGTALDLEPFAARAGRAGSAQAELVPVLAGDEVLLSSTLRLFALDRRTGELVWSAGPPPGWDELAPHARKDLFRSLDDERVLAAPAASDRIAVAALQIPQSRSDNEDWQGIPTSVALPERRLFAFELTSGRPLWDHAPPASWDGFSGPFAERMNVAGSPLVVDGLVLVPCTFDSSSVDYHVACYDLATGRLLWSTFVTRSQVERNLFGCAVFPFAASPLVLAAGRRTVIAQTGLGVVAAVDLAHGYVRWSAEYDPIPLPKTRSYAPPARERVWRLTAPVVAGDVVVAAPPDSKELLAVALDDGRRLWSVRAATLNELDRHDEGPAFDHLIGADAETIYLGGPTIAALAKAGGLASADALEPLWVHDTERATGSRSHLADDIVLVPVPNECLVLDRASGEPREPLELPGARGLLVTEEALFATARNSLHRVAR